MKFLNNKFIFIIQRVLITLIMVIFWGLTNCPLVAVAMILLISIPSIIRYKIINSRWLGVSEFIISISFSFFWIPSLTGLWLIILGITEDFINIETNKISSEVYKNREKNILLENEFTNVNKQIEQVAINAEIAERNRIAQDLHDHVGHEIAGISLGLQAIKKMIEQGKIESAENMLNNVIIRTNDAGIHLRETVHNLKPVIADDYNEFENICTRFSHCPVRFSKNGCLNNIEYNHREILIALLKEALTNVIRHSSATMVDVNISVNNYHIRMIISDNGKLSTDFVMGMGLSGMKERISNINGIFSIDASNGFKIICVLPLKIEKSEVV